MMIKFNIPLAKKYGDRAGALPANDAETTDAEADKTYQAYDWLAPYDPPVFSFMLLLATDDRGDTDDCMFPYSAIQRITFRSDRLQIQTHDCTITFEGRNLRDTAFLDAFNAHRINRFREWHPTLHQATEAGKVRIDKITIEEIEEE